LYIVEQGGSPWNICSSFVKQKYPWDEWCSEYDQILYWSEKILLVSQAFAKKVQAQPALKIYVPLLNQNKYKLLLQIIYQKLYRLLELKMLLPQF